MLSVTRRSADRLAQMVVIVLQASGWMGISVLIKATVLVCIAISLIPTEQRGQGPARLGKNFSSPLQKL